MAVALLVPLVGCSLGADDEVEPASKAAAQVAATVERLERATAARRYGEICTRLLTPRARERSGGTDCPRVMRTSARGIEEPSIEITAISVRGARATVEVVTRAAGQGPVEDRLQLRRSRGDWRIEGLG